MGNATYNPAADPLIEIARAWASIENEDVEINPRELAHWFASWRDDASAVAGIANPALAALLDEAMGIDGSGHPMDFVDWFIDWRRRVMSTLANIGFGAAIAGVPVAAGLSSLLFHHDDELSGETRELIEGALDGLEQQGYTAVAAASAAELFATVLAKRPTILPADPTIKVFRRMAGEYARRKLEEYRAFVAAVA